MKTKTAILALLAAAVLAACGGGDDTPSDPPANQSVPASASASVAGLVGYLRALVVLSDDTSEPVDVSAVTPQTDDAVEPTSVD
jgi:ABC-type glycerol-3-phosphate transport system substrate-binding protein